MINKIFQVKSVSSVASLSLCWGSFLVLAFLIFSFSSRAEGMSQCLSESLAASKGQATTITMFPQPWRSDQETVLNLRFSLQRLTLLPSLCFNKRIFTCLVKLKNRPNFKVEFFMDETMKIWCLYPQHTGSRIEQLITDLAVKTYLLFLH